MRSFYALPAATSHAFKMILEKDPARESALPARTKAVWHTMSTAVTKAKERSVRRGLRVFPQEQAPVSIASHWLVGLAELEAQQRWGVIL